jgi:Mrp family chromosome partitioning ATPase
MAVVTTGVRRLLALHDESGDDASTGRSLLVTSAQPRDGRTSLACDLAVALARTGLQVVLVDADVESPDVAGRLGVEERDGLASVLAGERAVAEALVAVDPPALRVLPAAASGRPLPADRVRALDVELRELADVVVYDGPSVLAGTDAPELAAVADATLWVVRLGHSEEAAVAQGLDRLVRIGLEPAGLVLTGGSRTGGALARRPTWAGSGRPRRRAGGSDPADGTAAPDPARPVASRPSADAGDGQLFRS